ncbi:MAG: homocysteine S-methyltransferase [Candidatus Nanopelagicales bacterium]|jgi:homocysteine S-methyltransferase
MGVTWTDLFGDRDVVLDGGLSTQLTAQGANIRGSLWTGRALLEQPDLVGAAHAAFVRAGADVVTTASYQVSRSGFEAAGLAADDVDRALEAATEVARAAVASVPGAHALVAASVGPYGATLHDGSEYRGQYGLTREELADFHRERLAVLVASKPDLLAIETIPDVDEALALADALADFPDVPAWMSFSAADGTTTCAGQPIAEAAAVAASIPSVVAMGVNCTDPRYVEELVVGMHAAAPLPIVVYPNAGGSWDPVAEGWTGAFGRPDAALPPIITRRWRYAGAIAVGGCCGTDARTVAALAATRH